MLKKILFGVVALIVLLVAVILFRTFTYGGAATGGVGADVGAERAGVAGRAGGGEPGLCRVVEHGARCPRGGSRTGWRDCAPSSDH